MIIDGFNLKNVIAVAQTHPQIRDIVEIIMIKKISIFIVSPDDWYGIGTDFNTIFRLFQFYGYRILKLSIAYELLTEHDRHDEFNKYVNKYVAPTLKHLDLRISYHTYNPANGLGPFPMVDTVRIREIVQYNLLENFNLAEIFPALHTLDASQIGPNSGNLTQQFPHLKRLTVPVITTTEPFEYSIFVQILELNPQIQHLNIPVCDWTVLELLNRIRPDIEELQISGLIFRNIKNISQPLRFQNMKKLTCYPITYYKNFIKDFDENDQILMEFGNLEEIQFNEMHFTQQWVDIVLKNKNLKKIVNENGFNDTQLQQITDGLPNLEYFGMADTSRANTNGTQYYASLNGTIRFMNNANSKLRTVFLKGKTFTTNCNLIAKEVTNNWKCITLGVHCYFTRKLVRNY